jgi:hypothetical protein
VRFTINPQIKRIMKIKKCILTVSIFLYLSVSHSLFAQNIKFYTTDALSSINSVDFDTDSILYIAVKADSAIAGFDMMLFTTTLSRKNGKRKWQKANNLMSETFYGKLKDDGYYHFVAFRSLGGGLSYSEIGLTNEDLRFGEVQMNVSLHGKKRLNPINVNEVETDVNVINTTGGFIQYEADIVDFSLPITLERYSESTNIRSKRNLKLAGIYIGTVAVILSPTLILLRVL